MTNSLPETREYNGNAYQKSSIGYAMTGRKIADEPIISDRQARDIANSWHGGGGSALYAFASTGAIDTARADHNLKAEIGGCIAWVQKYGPHDYPNESDWTGDYHELSDLLAYVKHHGPRPRQDHWKELPWD